MLTISKLEKCETFIFAFFFFGMRQRLLDNFKLELHNLAVYKKPVIKS